MNFAAWRRQQRTPLTEQSWEDLFDFLDPRRAERQGPDRDREAEGRCLLIGRKLVCFFAGRGCGDAEDLASETLLRVAAKCAAVDTSGFPDRTGYFYGVARNVLHEWHRDRTRDARMREALKHEPAPPDDPQPASQHSGGALSGCLERCLATLNPRARRLILGYYGAERAATVDQHRTLADGLGKSVNALRIEVHRIRRTLRECVRECMDPGVRRAPLHAPLSRR